MSNIDNEPQVILLTSAVPGEGKTTLAIALTRYLSKMEGKRALLLEADIRRNTLRFYIDSKPPVELMDILLGKTSSENIDLYNEDLEIELLTGTNSSGNAADLFASRRFKDLMAALRETFGYIVIDSPPVLAVPDARVLASYSDAVVFVVRWSVTSKTQVQQGILGVIEDPNFPGLTRLLRSTQVSA
jgi:Mrp family chromosome partitioning ATPase